MSRTLISALALSTALASAAAAQDGEYLDYPDTPTVDQVDTYQTPDGTEDVADPYRWLEDSVRTNPDVAAWVAAQNEVTNAYLETLPGRAAIEDRLTELWNYERFGTPEEDGGRYFYSRNDGLQNQSVYYVQDGLDGDPRVLIDPNAWTVDGTQALAGTSPSPDGSMVAYLVADGGSDWRTIHVIDVETGEVMDDRIEWAKFTGVSWAADGSGFYYSRYPAPEEGVEFTSLNMNQAVYFHTVGTPQSDDVMIMSDPDNPELGWGATVSEDGNFLVLTSWTGTDGNGTYVLSLTEPNAQPIEIFGGFDNNHGYDNERNDYLWRKHDHIAYRYKIIETIGKGSFGQVP